MATLERFDARAETSDPLDENMLHNFGWRKRKFMPLARNRGGRFSSELRRFCGDERRKHFFFLAYALVARWRCPLSSAIFCVIQLHCCALLCRTPMHGRQGMNARPDQTAPSFALEKIGESAASAFAFAPIDLISRIQRIEGDLSPAERRVAAAVAADYEATTRMTISDLAARAGVSQPSVTRFCRVGRLHLVQRIQGSSGDDANRRSRVSPDRPRLRRRRRPVRPGGDDACGERHPRLSRTARHRRGRSGDRRDRRLQPARHLRSGRGIGEPRGGREAALLPPRSSGLRLLRRPPAAHVSLHACGRETSPSPSPTAASRSPSWARSRSRGPTARRPSRSRGRARRSPKRRISSFPSSLPRTPTR